MDCPTCGSADLGVGGCGYCEGEARFMASSDWYDRELKKMEERRRLDQKIDRVIWVAMIVTACLAYFGGVLSDVP